MLINHKFLYTFCLAKRDFNSLRLYKLEDFEGKEADSITLKKSTTRNFHMHMIVSAP